MSSTDAAVHARIARLFVYPVKSCAGVALEQARLTATGLELDRAWMVVDADGVFLTQREWPRLALVHPRITPDEVLLQAPGMPTLPLPREPAGEQDRPARVRVWKDTVNAWDMGDAAAQWFSRFLAQAGLRLARFDPRVRRLSDLAWTKGVEAVNQFVDGYPLLVIGEASLAELNRRLTQAGHGAIGIERLRPNLLLADLQAHDEDSLAEIRIATREAAVVLAPVKPCARCPIPNIDPATAERSPEVLATLTSYRADPRMDGKPTFGMNAIIVDGIGRTLRTGDTITADWNFA